MIVAFVPDLMDRSKVQAAAHAAGEEIRFVTSAGELGPLVATAPPTLVLVDLARPGVLEALPALAALTDVRIVGFGSHVDRDRLDAARAAGAGTVLARSEFFRRLAELVGGSPGTTA